MGSLRKILDLIQFTNLCLRTARDLENDRHRFNFLKQRWGIGVLDLFNVDLEIKGQAHLDQPTLLVGNHISYLDIPLIVATAPASFVAKQDLLRWPVVKNICLASETILVKRESKTSRQQASQIIGRALTEEKKSVVIFPSGTTCVEEKKPWRWGAFQIARDHNIPLQPFRICYQPLRPVAFIDDDALLPHLWRLFKHSRITASIEFHPPIYVQDIEKAAHDWWTWSREALLF